MLACCMFYTGVKKNRRPAQCLPKGNMAHGAQCDASTAQVVCRSGHIGDRDEEIQYGWARGTELAIEHGASQ